MERRSFTLGGAAALAGVLAHGACLAQPGGRTPRVGLLINGMPAGNPAVDAVKRNFAQLGYVEGTSLVLEGRFAEGRLERLPALAGELVDMGVDAIATFGGPATSAAVRATKSIPIVFAIVADPVAVGFVASLERPGGNATGITNNDPEQARRQVELLKQLVPALSRLAVLSDADIPGADASGLAPIERASVAAAKALGVDARVLKVRGPAPDLDASFESMSAANPQALLVLEVPVALAHRKRIAELAAARRLPSMFSAGSADAGGILSHGTKVEDTWPRVPAYVDRILKGARPEQLPVEVVSQRELVVNLRAARESGIAVPADLVKLATRVVE